MTAKYITELICIWATRSRMKIISETLVKRQYQITVASVMKRVNSKREPVSPFMYFLQMRWFIPFQMSERNRVFIVSGGNQLWKMWNIFHSGLTDGKIRINRTIRVTCGEQRTGHTSHDRGFSPVGSRDKMSVCSCLSESDLHATLKQEERSTV
jgi:hypothetical protein